MFFKSKNVKLKKMKNSIQSLKEHLKVVECICSSNYDLVGKIQDYVAENSKSIISKKWLTVKYRKNWRGMGTFNVLNLNDLLLIIFTVVNCTLGSIFTYKTISYNIVGKLLSQSINFYLLFLAGGYTALFTYFHI